MILLLRLLFGVVLPVAVLIIGGKAAFRLIETGPQAVRKNSESRKARLVEVQPVRSTTEVTIVHAMGTVKPARRIELQPRVSGEVIDVSDELMPGGLFRTGDTILCIDPTDYELIVRQKEGDLANAMSAYQLELGSQSIAQREYEILGETILEEDRDLVLRKPQLRTVEAAVDIAEAALEKAKLDLQRTTVKAPFNAMVESRDVNLGMQVNAATSLTTLVGTDEYWIELSVAVDQLQWIRIPRANGDLGSPVRVYNEAAWGANVHRSGRVVRLTGGLEEEGRMARLIVSVPDPLGLSPENRSAPLLLINSYVRVEVEGIRLENIIAVDRRLLRDGETVWVMTGEGLLDIRLVAIAFRSRDRVFISGGIDAGELLVATDLAAPVAGMPLRTNGDEPEAQEAGLPAAGAAGSFPGGD